MKKIGDARDTVPDSELMEKTVEGDCYAGKVDNAGDDLSHATVAA